MSGLYAEDNKDKAMGKKKKDESRQIKSTVELANYQATVWIALHGIEKAERIAELTLQKIKAQKK